MTHLGNPWFTPQMAAPVGVQLGFHTLMPLPGVLFTPVTLGLRPGLLLQPDGPCSCPGCSATRCTGRPGCGCARLVGAVGAAVFFGLSCMLTQQDWYHLNIALGAMFLPMALEASVRLRRQPGRRQAIILGLVMGVAVLTDQESAVLAAIVVALVLLPWLLRHPGWPRLWPVLLACAAGAVVASPQIVAMLQEVVPRTAACRSPRRCWPCRTSSTASGCPGCSPPRRGCDFGLEALAGPFLHGRDNEGMPMFGTTLTVLALLGLIAELAPPQSPGCSPALWLGCAALALGTSLWIGKTQYLPLSSVWNGVRVSDLMPYTWFVRLPGLSSFREADRLAILGLLPAALLAGAAVNWIRYHARPVLVRGVVLGDHRSPATLGRPRRWRHAGQLPAARPGIADDHSQLDRGRSAVRACAAGSRSTGYRSSPRRW